MCSDASNSNIHTCLNPISASSTLLRAKFSKNQGVDFVKAERLIFKGKLTFFVQISIGRFLVEPEGSQYINWSFIAVLIYASINKSNVLFGINTLVLINLM